MAVQPAERRIAIPADDAVVVFRTVRSNIRGRLVRLGAAADAVLTAHRLPEPAAEALGQALTLSALIGSALPADGKIILQTRTNGAISLLVADFEAPGGLRGYARYDAGVASQTERASAIGSGHLAMTIDPGAGSERYQGVMALDGASLAKTAAEYFENREALPTFIRLACAQHYANAGQGASWRWRAGGLMIQSIGAPPDDGDYGEEGEHWTRARTLAETLQDHELLDPGLEIERLLLRLFHEEGVLVDRSTPLVRYCRCSRERVADVLSSFGAKEVADMTDEAGRIVVTCEFCANAYVFEPSDVVAKTG
ncbi:MAG: Hsp33 family molecular chaperone HslO [Hyphomicrobium sp.]